MAWLTVSFRGGEAYTAFCILPILSSSAEFSQLLKIVLPTVSPGLTHLIASISVVPCNLSSSVYEPLLMNISTPE